MATHSATLAWKIPWTEEPGGLQSMGLQSPTLSDFTFTFPWPVDAAKVGDALMCHQVALWTASVH